MPDGTIAAIDRFFDLVDHGVDHVDRVLNRGKQTAEQQRVRKARRSEIIDVESVPTPKSSKREERKGRPSTTALARKPRFYIVEAPTESGCTHFVVTDGGNARAECTSRALAEQILQALEGTS